MSKHRGISHDQVCDLVARDRTKATVSKVACMGRIVKTKVDTMIGTKLTFDNVLVTDAWRAYKTYAKDKGLKHYRIKSKQWKTRHKRFIPHSKCKWYPFPHETMDRPF